MIVGKILDQLAHAGAELVREVGRGGPDEGVDVVSRRLDHPRQPNHRATCEFARNAGDDCARRHQCRAVGAGRGARLPVGAVRLQPARLRPGAARGVPRALGREDAERRAAGRHESRALRHGADGRSVRRRRDGARLPRDHGTGRTACSRASAAADHGLRVHALGGERHPVLGLGARSLLDGGPVLRPGLRRELVPARLHGRVRTEPHSGQAPGRRACSALPRLRRGTREDRRRAAARARRWHRPLRRATGARGSRSTGLASGASRTRAPRAPPRTAAGRKPSTRGFASSGSSRADSVGACADRRLSS